MTQNLVGSPSSQSRDNLIALEHPVVILPIVVANGEGVLAHGTVLGRVTTSGEYAAYLDGQTDGTGSAVCVLWAPPDGIDATSSSVKTYALFHGGVRRTALTGIDDAAVLDLMALGVWAL